MDQNSVIQECCQHMEESLKHFQVEMTKIRTGRASVSLLDGVRVEYYGSEVPLNQVGTLSTPEPGLIVIAPWDKSAISGIVKAVQKADLGFQPVDDGKVVRVPIPPLSEERRKEIAKKMKKVAEESRVSVRNCRRDGNENLKNLNKKGEISEDDLKKSEQIIQTQTDTHVKKIDEILHNKEKEVMKV